MSTTPKCTDPALMERFIRGDLPEADYARIGDHLRSCDACLTRLEALCSEDVLSIEGRRAEPLLPDRPGERARIERIKPMSKQALSGQPSELDTETKPPPVVPPPATEQGASVEKTDPGAFPIITPPSAAVRQPPRKKVGIFAAAATMLVAAAAAVFIAIDGPAGTVIVESDDPALEIRVKGNDINLLSGERTYTLKLKPGKYTVEFPKGAKADTDKFTLERAGTVKVRVRMVQQAVMPAEKQPE